MTDDPFDRAEGDLESRLSDLSESTRSRLDGIGSTAHDAVPARSASSRSPSAVGFFSTVRVRPRVPARPARVAVPLPPSAPPPVEVGPAGEVEPAVEVPPELEPTAEVESEVEPEVEPEVETELVEVPDGVLVEDVLTEDVLTDDASEVETDDEVEAVTEEPAEEPVAEEPVAEELVVEEPAEEPDVREVAREQSEPESIVPGLRVPVEVLRPEPAPEPEPEPEPEEQPEPVAVTRPVPPGARPLVRRPVGRDRPLRPVAVAERRRGRALLVVGGVVAAALVLVVGFFASGPLRTDTARSALAPAALPALPETAPDPGRLTQISVDPEGTATVTEWLTFDDPVDAVRITPPTTRPGRVSAAVVDGRGEARIDLGTRSPQRVTFEEGVDRVRVRYTVRDAVSRSDQDPDRALLDVPFLGMSAGGDRIGPTVLDVRDAKVLGVACGPTRRSATPCGDDTGRGWEVSRSPKRSIELVAALDLV